MKKLFIFSFGLLMCSSGFTQNNESKNNEFTVGAQLRPRAEYRNGAIAPHADGADPAGFITNRTRLSMDYKRDKLSLGFSGQNVGVWGQEPQVVTAGRFMLNEAWANLNFGEGFFMKMGRQSLAYDDERILGALDWNVSGRYHDALKMGYENNRNKLHVLLAFNQSAENTTGTYYASGAQPYKTMQTLWYQHTESKMFNISFLLMNLGLETGSAPTSDVRFLQTYGTNITYQPSGFQFYGSFYYQSGKTAGTVAREVSAYMGSINASYLFNPAWKLTLASDYLSGNDGKDANKYKAFNVLYGTHHKFYGTMDYFYAGTSFLPGMNPGLWDNQLALTFKTSPKVSLALSYHHFQTTTDIYSGDVKQTRALGSEWDFQFTWNVMKDVTMTGGYSTFFGNDALKAVKGGDPSKYQDWMWVSLNINPKIFITKW